MSQATTVVTAIEKNTCYVQQQQQLQSTHAHPQPVNNLKLCVVLG